MARQNRNNANDNQLADIRPNFGDLTYLEFEEFNHQANELVEIRKLLNQRDCDFYTRGNKIGIRQLESDFRRRLDRLGWLDIFLSSLSRWDQIHYKLSHPMAYCRFLKLRLQWMSESKDGGDIPFEHRWEVFALLMEIPAEELPGLVERAFRLRPASPHEALLANLREYYREVYDLDLVQDSLEGDGEPGSGPDEFFNQTEVQRSHDDSELVDEADLREADLARAVEICAQRAVAHFRDFRPRMKRLQTTGLPYKGVAVAIEGLFAIGLPNAEDCAFRMVPFVLNQVFGKDGWTTEMRPSANDSSKMTRWVVLR